MRNLGVVIPALNEALHISSAIESARRAGAVDIVVADGGSRDSTRDAARAAGARVIECPAIRGVQLNEGARAVSGDVLVFLHADTELPPGAGEIITAAVDAGADFGAFTLRFREHSARLRVAERLINARARLTGSAWGDQAQFITRTAFEACGGYRPIPILEDYDLARRMKGRVHVLPSSVTTSGRRFLQKGVLRTAIINWALIAGFELGISPDRLAKIYRS